MDSVKIRRYKGILYFFAFIFMGVFLYLEQHLGAMRYLTGFGIPPIVWSVFFIISGVANLVIGIRGYDWNTVWFTPYFAYTTSTLVVKSVTPTFPTAPVILYGLLAMLILMDVMIDVVVRYENNKRG